MLAPPNLNAGRVQNQVRKAEHTAASFEFGATNKRANPGDQLIEGKGLDEIVVRTDIKSENAVLNSVARGQH